MDPRIINLKTIPDQIRISYQNDGRIFAYCSYGNITYRLLVKQVIGNIYKLTAVNPSL